MARVLIVDDMAAIREPMCFALRQAGHHADAASSGTQALALLRESPPDVLILDAHMPDMSGMEVLRRIRSDPSTPQPHVFLLAVDSDRESVLAALKLGVKNYLLKSNLDFDSLLLKIETLTNSPPEKPGAPRRPPVAEPEPRELPLRSLDDFPPSPDEAIKLLKPIVKRSEVSDRLGTIDGLHALSPAIAEVINLSRSATASLHDIARAIKRDPGITLKVLRLANSTAFSRGDTVDSIDKAVLRIGAGVIGQAALNMGLIEHFSGQPLNSLTDPLLFWEHSIGVALIAARIAGETGSHAPDKAFTLGLIHDMGRLVFDAALAERYADAVQAAQRLGLPLERVESRMLLLNHADAMERILRGWRFPRDLGDPVMLHHLNVEEIRARAGPRFAEAATLALANRLAKGLLIGSSGNDCLYTTAEFCDALAVPPALIADIEGSIREKTNDLKIAMLSAASKTAAWPDPRRKMAERLGVPFHPLFIGSQPATDAFRVFCDSMRSAGEEPPTLALAHLATLKDRAALRGWLRAAESESRAAALPLLVLCSNRVPPPSPDDDSPREMVCLTTPVTMDRIFAAARNLIPRPAHAAA